MNLPAPIGRAADSPVKIVFDSDVDHDCDDIAALFSTLVAVCGPTLWFEVVREGANIVDPKTGTNT